MLMMMNRLMKKNKHYKYSNLLLLLAFLIGTLIPTLAFFVPTQTNNNYVLIKGTLRTVHEVARFSSLHHTHLFLSTSSSSHRHKSRSSANHNNVAGAGAGGAQNKAKKKKKNNKSNEKQNRPLLHDTIKHRHSKQEMKDLIKSIGLKPVEHPTSKNTNASSEEELLSLLQSTKSIPIKTQLQYTRNGHAALRSIIPPSIIHKLRHELIQYSKDEELNAWKQKVEVATKSIQIAESCTTISQCKSILLQQQSDNATRDDDTYMLNIPFLQHFNTWQSLKSNSTVYKLVTSTYLSNIASQLLDVPSVRLYQDSLFHKRSIDGPTPWHSDARMAPFDTSNMITFWIPLDYIPCEEDGGTGLLFVDKSHVDFALPFWNPVPKCDLDVDDYIDSKDSSSSSSNSDVDDVYARLEERYGGEESVKHYMPIDIGDCTVHAGWTLHCANGMILDKEEEDDGGYNHSSKQDRYALAVTYVDAKAEIRREIQQELDDYDYDNGNKLGHDEDRQSFRKWINKVPPRTPYFEHPLVPIVWPK